MENADKVRAVSSAARNRELDRATLTRLRHYERGKFDDISRRIDELDREWDIERVLETNASILALTGLALGATRNKKWLMLPGVVASFLLQHAVQGWCPPVPVFRRLGVRTRKEIDEEKYALKSLRGDFSEPGSVTSADAALRSVRI